MIIHARRKASILISNKSCSKRRIYFSTFSRRQIGFSTISMLKVLARHAQNLAGDVKVLIRARSAQRATIGIRNQPSVFRLAMRRMAT